MKAQELRIGNCVMFRDIEHQITGTWGDKIKFGPMSFWSNETEVFPIPLTPEILRACTFEYEDMGDDSPYERWICKDYNELWVWNYNNEEWMICLGNGFEQGGFHSLHQLQNLYHALTNTELQISL